MRISLKAFENLVHFEVYRTLKNGHGLNWEHYFKNTSIYHIIKDFKDYENADISETFDEPLVKVIVPKFLNSIFETYKKARKNSFTIEDGDIFTSERVRNEIFTKIRNLRTFIHDYVLANHTEISKDTKEVHNLKPIFEWNCNRLSEQVKYIRDENLTHLDSKFDILPDDATIFIYLMEDGNYYGFRGMQSRICGLQISELNVFKRFKNAKITDWCTYSFKRYTKDGLVHEEITVPFLDMLEYDDETIEDVTHGVERPYVVL